MRAISVASAALLGVSALACSAPAAVARDTGGHSGTTPFGFSVMPSAVSADGRVTLQVERERGGCRGPATVSSGIFDTVSIPTGSSSVTATVDEDARPGSEYQVTFTCDDESGSTDLTIAGDRERGAQGSAGQEYDGQGRDSKEYGGQGNDSEGRDDQGRDSEGRDDQGRDSQGRDDQERSGQGRGGQERDSRTPEHYQHGVRAGEGGTLAGFNLKEIGLGAALVVGSIGTAYHLSRRRAGVSGA